MTEPFFTRRVSQSDENAQRVADYVWKAVASLRQTQWLSPAEIERRQMRAFRKLLGHCLRHVPWYRETMAGDPADFHSLSDLWRLPVLPRRTYQQHASQFLAETLPRNMVATGSVGTSGTSGVPVSVQQTNIVNLWWCAFALRDLEWSGIDARGRLAVIRSLHTRRLVGADSSKGLSQPTWGRPFSEWIETGPSFALDIQCPVERQLAWLREVDPDCLLSYPANLDALAAHVRESGTPLSRLKVVQSISEPLTSAARERIESAFGVPLKDGYSCQEVGYVASQCHETGIFHVHAENAILEVVDETGQPVPAGGTGRVLLTTLLNYQTPLIRYEVGDEAVSGAPCSCGRGLPTLLRIHGKLRPLLRLPSGRLKSSSGLAERISDVPGHRQYQVEQTSVHSATLRLVPGAGWQESRRVEYIAILHEFFEAPSDVRIELCDRIPPGAGGKTPAFIALPDDGSRLGAG